MDKKYVVRYQPGSGGFLVAWLLQMAVQSDCFDDALHCFHHSLKNDPTRWLNYEITPPNIALLGISPDYSGKQSIEKVINNNTSIDSIGTLDTILKYFLNNHIYEQTFSFFTSGGKNLKLDKNKILPNIHNYSNFIYTSKNNIFVDSPGDFINLARSTKAATDNGTVHYVKKFVTDIPQSSFVDINAVINKYKDSLNLFPIKSVWEGDWKEHLENCVGLKLTPHQEHRCRTIISRWLEIQPTEIKKYINL